MVRVGETIRIISMQGEPHYSDRTGKVTCIDDIGQLHGTWGGLAIIPGVDDYTVIDEQ